MAHFLQRGEPPGDAAGQNPLLRVLPNDWGQQFRVGVGIPVRLARRLEGSSEAATCGPVAASFLSRHLLEPIFIIPGAAKRHG